MLNAHGCQINQRDAIWLVRSGTLDPDQDLWSKIPRLMAHHRNWWILAQGGIINSFDACMHAPMSEWPKWVRSFHWLEITQQYLFSNTFIWWCQLAFQVLIVKCREILRINWPNCFDHKIPYANAIASSQSQPLLLNKHAVYVLHYIHFQLTLLGTSSIHCKVCIS